MSTDRDVTRIVRSWLNEDAHEDADRILNLVLAEVDTTPQRRASWLARRFPIMHTNLARLGIAAAAVVVVAVVGYNLLPGLGIVGPGATPSPSPSLLARGNFVTDYETVEFEANGEGSSVTGRMTVSQFPGEEPWAFTVDLQCTRTYLDGAITIIGGLITDSTNRYAPVGTWAAISLKRGSPVQAAIAYLRGGHPIAYAPSCLAALDAEVGPEPSTFDAPPIDGTVEFGP